MLSSTYSCKHLISYKKFSNHDIATDSDIEEIVSPNNCILIVSAESSSQGDILQASDNIQNIIGYRSEDVIGCKNTIFMPPCIKQYHYRYMERLAKRMDQDMLNFAMPIYTRMKDGLYTYAAVNIRLSPSLNCKLHYICLLFLKDDQLIISGKPIDIEHQACVFLCSPKGDVFGVNLEARNVFGVTPAILNGEEDSLNITGIIKNYPLSEKDGNFLDVSYKKIEEVIKADEEEKDSSILCWKSDITSTYGREDYESSMRIIKLFPLVDADELEKIASISKKQFDKHTANYQSKPNLKKINCMERTLNTTNPNSSTMSSGPKNFVELKQSINIAKPPEIVKKVQCLIIIFFFLEVMMAIIIHSINVVLMNGFKSQVEYSSQFIEREKAAKATYLGIGLLSVSSTSISTSRLNSTLNRLFTDVTNSYYTIGNLNKDISLITISANIGGVADIDSSSRPFNLYLLNV